MKSGLSILTNRNHRVGLGITLLVVALTACTSSRSPAVNSDAKEAVDIHFALQDMPSGVDVIAQAVYEIENPNACIALDHAAALGGARLGLHAYKNIPVNAGVGKYSTRAFADAYLPTRYYMWKEKCTYKLSAIALRFSKGKYARVAGIGTNEMAGSREKTFYCPSEESNPGFDSCINRPMSGWKGFSIIKIEGA